MCTRHAFLAGVAAFAGAPALASARTGDPQELEVAFPSMRRVSDTLWIGAMTPNLWIYTTTDDIGGGSGFYPANGAIAIDGETSILVDTAWSDAHANAILREWDRLAKPPIRTAIATHFHRDRTGGIGALAARGIPTFANPLTIGLAQDAGLPVPRPLHDVEKRAQSFGALEVSYPGAGHTLDNVVVWSPRDRILFGGCLVKSITATDLGYVDDARIGAWPATMRAVARAYPSPRVVIPGHGTVAGNAIAHTEHLAKAALAHPA